MPIQIHTATSNVLAIFFLSVDVFLREESTRRVVYLISFNLSGTFEDSGGFVADVILIIQTARQSHGLGLLLLSTANSSQSYRAYESVAS